MSDLTDLDARIQAIDVQAGDIIIVKTSRPVTMTTAERIQTVLADALRAGGAPQVPVLVLDGDMNIEVVRPLPGKSPFITREELAAAIREKAGMIP